MKLIHQLTIALCFSLLTGCTFLTAETAQTFSDDVLYNKILQHDHYLSRYSSDRRQQNRDTMVAEMQRRYPGWSPAQGYPVRTQSVAVMESTSTECSSSQILELKSSGLTDSQIAKACE